MVEQPSHRGAGPRRSGRVLPLLVLSGLVLAALTAFVVTRQVVEDQNRALLTQRADEVAALLDNSVGAIESRLQVLGTVATNADAAAAEVFSDSAGPLLEGGTVAIGVAADAGGGFVVTSAVGQGPAAGARLAGALASTAERAVAEGQLVSALYTDASGSRLALALPVRDAVVYQVSALDPTRPVPSTEESPFRGLQVALYAGPSRTSSQLIVATQRDLPLSGLVSRRPLTVGADRWGLDVASDEPLVGSFAVVTPWLLLGGGLVAAVLAGAVTVVLAQRRSYALALVDERTADLRQAREAADAANHSKSAFLSRMSHELRTPLNAVLGFGQLLEMEKLTDAQRESVAHILNGGRHLLDLINEVLDITRVETGNLSLSPEAVRAGDLLDDSLDLIRPLAEQRGITLAAEGTVEWDAHVFADRQRTKQVLLNLLSNAIKYNRQRGSVTVSCARVGEEWLRISVTDTGPGIPEEDLDRVFTPFERLGAQQTDVEGTGIGLSLSQRLAEAMGGSLGVDSTPGRGSTFWVELPRVEAPVARFERLNGAGRPDAVEPAPRGERRIVLHIEDNLANVKLVERVLAQRPGIEVVPAMQGRLGLELAHQHQLALILLDLHLPDMGGEQVLQRLRDDPATASIPVAIVSADATAGQVQRLLAAGATAYLTKPIQVAELLSLVDDVMATR